MCTAGRQQTALAARRCRVSARFDWANQSTAEHLLHSAWPPSAAQIGQLAWGAELAAAHAAEAAAEERDRRKSGHGRWDDGHAHLHGAGSRPRLASTNRQARDSTRDCRDAGRPALHAARRAPELDIAGYARRRRATRARRAAGRHAVVSLAHDHLHVYTPLSCQLLHRRRCCGRACRRRQRTPPADSCAEASLTGHGLLRYAPHLPAYRAPQPGAPRCQDRT
jgi:hypothetical protein